MADPKKISIVVEAIDRTTATVKAINGTIARMVAPARATQRALGGLLTQTGYHRVAKAAGDVGRSFRGMLGTMRSIAATGAVAVGALGGMFFALTRITGAGEDAVKSAQRFGTTITEWQKMRYAAELGDVSVEDLGQSLGQLNKRAVAAAMGNQEMAVWFQRAGISVKDQNGKVKSSTTLLAELADVFAGMPDGPKKLALANALLRDSQGKLIPFLNGGSKAMRAAGAEAVALGLVDEKLARDSAEFNDELKRVRGAAQGVGNIIASALLPSLKAMLPEVVQWIKDNRELIRGRVTEWADGLSKALPQIVEGLGFVGGAIGWVISMVNRIVQAIGGWGTVISALGGLLAGKLVWSVLMFAKSLKTLGLVMTVTPFGLFMIAVSALAAGAYLLIKHWDKVKSWFLGFIDDVLKPVRTMMEKINSLVPDFMKHTADLPAKAGLKPAESALAAGFSPRMGRQEIGGVLRIDVNGPGRVSKASAFGGIDLDIYSGLTPAGTK